MGGKRGIQGQGGTLTTPDAFHSAPTGICSDRSYSSRVEKGCGMSEILYLAAVFTRRSEINTLGFFASVRAFFLAAASSLAT